MAQPLAERLRPKTLDDYIGQKHLVGQGAILRKMIDAGRISSFILWGPPGVGKTTLAQIIANKLETPFYTLSAVTSGVKDVRDVIEKAKSNRFFSQAGPILFIDEIHRFSKSQQDSLLGAVETGVVTLIGATTENPSFEVIRPLLSRCQLYVLKSLEKDDLLELLHIAITKDVILKEKHIELQETDAMLRFSGGDARKLLNILELVVEADTDDGAIVITDEKVTERLQQNPLAYDKDLQEDKELTFDAIDTVKGCLALFNGMLSTMHFKKDRMENSAKNGFTNATDAADYLVGKGVPFRDAHGIVGRLVLYCIDKGISLDDMKLEEYKAISPVFEDDIYDAISMKTCVEKRNTIGAPGRDAMKKVIAINDTYLANLK